MNAAHTALDNTRLPYQLVQLSLTQALSNIIGREVEIVAIGSSPLDPQLDHRLCHTQKFVVMLVPELTQQSLPFLKYADCAVFFHAEQARLYRDLYGESTPHVVLDFLSTEAAPISGSSHRVNLVVPTPLSAAEYQRRFFHLKTQLDPATREIHLISAADPSFNAQLIRDLHTVLGPVDVKTISDMTQWGERELQPGKTLVLQPDSLSPYDMPDGESLIGSNLFRLTSFAIRSQAYELALQILQMRSDSAALIPAAVLGEIRRAWETKSQSADTITLPDTLESLNIVHGRPLTNRFVVSILYRNAGEKLLRALQSVLALAPGHDVGVALVDDCSTDGSLAPALALLQHAAIDAVVVSNLDRKYAARNYFNVIHHLTCNDDSVIMDLDGDDYLNLDLDVFAILEGAYADGDTQKTLGSYQLFTDAPQADLEQSEFYQSMRYFAQDNPVDLQQPWNIPTCPSWKHLRTTRRGLIRRVEIDYFLERSKTQWLRMEHDISVHSRAIELAAGKVKILTDKLYIYDISGDNHDNHAQARSKNSYIYKLFHAFTFRLEEMPVSAAPEQIQEADVDYI